jgi:hypothetical protein
MGYISLWLYWAVLRVGPTILTILAPFMRPSAHPRGVQGKLTPPESKLVRIGKSKAF